MTENIKPIDNSTRPAVDHHIKEEWGGPMVASRGNLQDTSRLPGFAYVGGDTLKGAVIYKIKGDECEIVVLFSIVQNRGTGSGLINAVLEVARENGCRRVWLITTNDNTQAIRFYQKFGFTLKAVHIGAMEESRRLKPQIPLVGIDGIPIQHEFEFEIKL